jgi:hypothetical protein
MVAGGVVQAIFGVSAERQALENIAMPLTAADPEGQTDAKRLLQAPLRSMVAGYGPGGDPVMAVR